MLLFKGKAIAAKKNLKKNPNGFKRLHFTLLGVQEVVRVRTDITIFRHSPIF